MECQQARALLAPGDTEDTARTASGGAATPPPTTRALSISLVGDVFIGDATHPDDVVWEPWAVFEELMATRSYMIIFTGRGYPDGSGWVGVDVVREERARWFRRDVPETSSPPVVGEEATVGEEEAAAPGPAGPIFDLRDYGATGGDVRADTAAFRAAVAAAQAAGGGTIRLHAGNVIDFSEHGEEPAMASDDTERQDSGVESCVHEDAVKWNPYNHVVQCHGCGEVFVPGRAATPADAIFGFAAWLTSRHERVGPFSRFDEAAKMAELAGEFCKYQGWEIGPNFPKTFRMPPDGGLNPTTVKS